MRTKSYSLLILYAWLILFCACPLLLVGITSMLSKSNLDVASLPLTLDNYRALFTPAFVKILWRSLGMAFTATLGCLIIAYPFSYVMVTSKHASRFLLFIIIPFWTSSLIRTYALLAILKYKGLLNALLLKYHLIATPLSLLYSNFAVLLGLIYNLLPFMILPIFTNMERFDFRLIEAAKDLGASKLIIFFRVFLPNTLSGIATGSLLVMLPAMTLFYIPNVLGGARSVLLGNLIQNQFLVLNDWPGGAATSMLLTVMLLLSLSVLRRFKERNI
ncbi:MAG: spermidine/putrescine ABC transporter permease [Legionellaceae bacterium]|nr:spermidine/putrescine ABC transporter permease [Legionellaceae bacterium]HAF87459.1 spermidine/putrescine ABC transporter permease [Legionellales bacterium]HCA89096.1 spermidine/putrescine ABC transporter permease [Legionellales bacterium]|tara:strand:- start:7415 stop:8236 length:822 start_codon:yes stop_codon:yes gene_type:complete